MTIFFTLFLISAIIGFVKIKLAKKHNDYEPKSVVFSAYLFVFGFTKSSGTK